MPGPVALRWHVTTPVGTRETLYTYVVILYDFHLSVPRNLYVLNS